MEVHEDGYKYLMEESGIYSVSGVLFDEGKWYLRCIRGVVSLVGGILSSGGCIGKVDGLCIWVNK